MGASVGFPAVSRADARVLILGSLPGAESLRRREYYANRGNRFWWIMGRIAGAGPELAYEARLDRLVRCGIALWDVCASAERPGSLDKRIVAHSVVVNDVRSFLEAHARVHAICFNGSGAATLFHRLVLPGLTISQSALRRQVLPSSSAAHAAMPAEEKLARWRSGLGDLAGEAAGGRASAPPPRKSALRR